MDKMQVITTVIRIAILLIVYILVPAAKKWLDDKSENEAINTVKQWAYTAVWAAEQIHNKAKHDDPTGNLRRQYAHEAIERMAFKLGIVLSEGEIDAMTECAVHELNGCRVPAVNEIAAPEKDKEDAKNAEWY